MFPPPSPRGNITVSRILFLQVHKVVKYGNILTKKQKWEKLEQLVKQLGFLTAKEKVSHNSIYVVSFVC